MMEDGLFSKYPCDAIFAMHNMPGHPQGHLLLRDGAAMASSDNVTITLEGVGGHGAMPHCAADPVVAGAAIVMGLQSIVARNVDPLHMSVITVGAFNAGKANNVIPQTATLKLSVRALDRDVRNLLNMPGHPQGHLLLRRRGHGVLGQRHHHTGRRGRARRDAALRRRSGAAGIVMGLQSIVARNVDPLHMSVITVGAFNAKANNVIPQTATLKLSVRALDRDVRNLLEDRITELVHNQAASYQVRATIDYKRGYPVLVNTVAETDFARRVALELVGADQVVPQTRR